ncbi:MAG: NADH-quinone oxidoreductase subunit B family protein [Planctomycetota bacterium]|jgi:F420-non-reducing hydrogenase small subunit
MSKPKVAFYWCSSCGGCEEAVVDLGEAILPVLEQIEIILWPVALDYKYKDIEAMSDGEITVSFINGAVRTEEQEHIANLLRKKSQLVVAFGSCAHTGGIPALANLTSKGKIFDCSYQSSPSVDNAAGTVPLTKSVCDGTELHLPEFYETVKKLDEAVEVDYYLPGCPPMPEIIADAVTAILEGKLPEKGTVLSSSKSLCSSCDRNESKPENVCVDKFKRVIEVELDPETCFLAQGVICMGPATRDGCGYPCVQGNMPCTGCFGAADSCKDQGGKMIATLGGIVEGEKEDTIDAALDSIADPAGTFYRYGMAASLLTKSQKEG